MRVVVLIAMYLAAIVGANVSFAIWGMAVEPWISMMLIGLDLTSRDYLHRAWGHRGLAWKMSLLILSGSALSAALGLLLPVVTGADLTTIIEGGIVRVAFASAAAFAAAGMIDALTYGVLRQRWLRINGSNLVAGLVDSAVFPIVAFGELNWWLIFYFGAVKFLGGAFWWLVLGGWRDVLALLGRAPAEQASA
jgi:uncharacterized PurR-regulated membrane protein YhhQ (DUF165 family)